FWALLIFLVTMILFLIPFLAFCYFERDPKKTRRFVSISRYWMDTFFFVVGCSIMVKGQENFMPGETYIVVCNHNSFFDIFISSPRIPGGNKTIAKIELARIPVFNLIYNSGTVLVDRKNDRSRSESFVKMKAVLDQGLHMCIYPEGTRNRTDQPLKAFHNGAFKLAIETNRSIIPAVIFNTRNVLPAKKTFFMWPQKMEISFLPAISPFPDESMESLKGRVFEIMKHHYLAGFNGSHVAKRKKAPGR
ncbi:MAG TPA: lysophospholipid acyltransferase family protein, partial [Puia sp.]|nr:lysophospholipid acyltransferase family protein [Puia sp.]